MSLVESAFGTRSFDRKGHEQTELQLSGIRICVISGPDSGQSASSTSGSLSVGTHDSNDLVLTDSAVSRRHVLVHLREKGLQVEDCRSKNGTWIGERRVTLEAVAAGTVIEVGATRLSVDAIAKPMLVQATRSHQFHGMLSRSDAMRKIFGLIHRLAERNHPVLIRGETGTGKELVARALHDAGPRSPAPVQVFNCGAATGDILPSELFGHERGAFTGAAERREGLFESAQGGTVILDELGELPLPVQAILLRVLETREVTRLGSRKAIPVDFRIVCATHRDIKQMVQAGTFREDLYFRLAAVAIQLPPLRERVEDIPLLANSFLEHFAREQNLPLRRLSTGAVDRMNSYIWPGNVRELRNLMWSLSIEPGGGMISREELERVQTELAPLPPPRRTPARPAPVLPEKQTTNGDERRELAGLLESTGWNIRTAAKLLGVTRATLYYRLARHGLKRPDSQEE